ncbi:MAG: S8 family serine peptidase [Anaerolineales bacterium]
MEKQSVQFPVLRSIILGATGFTVSLPLAVLTTFWINDHLVHWTVGCAVMGAFAGCLLGLAESTRRPAFRMALAGSISGGLSFPISYSLYQWIEAWSKGNPQEQFILNLLRVFPLFLFLAIGFGAAAGGKSRLLKFVFYGFLAEIAGALILEVITGCWGNTAGEFIAYAFAGGLTGWFLAREFPVAANSVQASFSRKGCLPVLKAISIFFLALIAAASATGVGIALSRINRRASQDVAFVAPSSIPALPSLFPKIDRFPPSMYGNPGSRGALSTLPSYDPASMDPFQMDLRGMDLSSLDLRNSLDELQHALFDDETVWPPSDRMPAGFDVERIMELGRNPGLGIRALHALGITGRGVGIAIIDQTLVADHREYAGRLRLYEEVGYGLDSPASMHGPAVASIAVGKTVGVAPEADLYFIADSMCTGENSDSADYACLAKSVRRIMDINQSLPEGRKIRVLSISIGWGPDAKGYEEIMDAVRAANAAGIFVVTTSLEVTNGLSLCPLGREPLADPDEFSSYEPGLFLVKDPNRRVFAQITILQNNCLWVTMDSRTTAEYSGPDDYVFSRAGGMSWSVPYVAGIYALAAQVQPDITPEQFWSLALSTGRTVWNGQTLILGPIVDPQALIAALQGGSME